MLFALTERGNDQQLRPVNSRFMDELLEYATGCDTRFDRSSELHAQSLCSVLKSSTPRPEHRIVHQPEWAAQLARQCCSNPRSFLCRLAEVCSADDGLHESTHSSRARQGSGEG